ncbi:hypothetical protein DXG01_001783 [Tephrocybe rancida]|nr:hypothetical protein DXG01_001783 [Tephrocybe rancida]
MNGANPRYVLGYGVDRAKVEEAVRSQNNDPDVVVRVSDRVISRLLERNVDSHEHPPVVGMLEDRTYIVISFGWEAFSDSREELEKKDIPAPAYFEQLKSILYGPAVFDTQLIVEG